MTLCVPLLWGAAAAGGGFQVIPLYWDEDYTEVTYYAVSDDTVTVVADTSRGFLTSIYPLVDKAYFEVEITLLSASHLATVGVIRDTYRSNFDQNTFFVMPDGAAYLSTGIYGRNGSSYGTLSTGAYGTGDVLMFAYDTMTGGLYMGKNGVWGNDPASGTPSAFTTGLAANYYVALAVDRAGVGVRPEDIVKLRIRESEFSHSIPSGYKSFEAAYLNIPDSPAADGTGTDPYWDEVEFLAGFEGTDGATDVDEEKHAIAITYVGAGQVDDAQFKWGSTSLHAGPDDNDDYAEFDGSLISTLIGDFTVEGWIRLNSLGGADRFISNYDNSIKGSWAIGKQSGTHYLEFYMNGADQLLLRGTTAMTTGTWYHFALCRYESTMRLFLDGVMQDSVEAYGVPLNRIQDVIQLGEFTECWMDDIRITAAGRYQIDTTFTPPIAALPRD